MKRSRKHARRNPRRRHHMRRGAFKKNPSTQTALLVLGAVAVGVGIYYYTRPAATPAVVPAPTKGW